MRFTPNVTGADTSPHNSAKSTSGATPFGRTQYSMMGGPPSVRGVNVVSDGRMSQPCAGCTMSSIGCPGPIGSSPCGGSGCISGITGLTDWGCPQLARGQRRHVVLGVAKRHRRADGSSIALVQLDVDEADPAPALTHGGHHPHRSGVRG